MFDLLGYPIPETPSMTDPLPWRVFRLNDCDWWLARSLAEAKASYLETFGLMSEEEAFDEPRELTDADLGRLIFNDWGMNTRRTFREELRRRIEDGVSVPGPFADTEY